MGRGPEVEAGRPGERVDEVAAGLACKVGRAGWVALSHNQQDLLMDCLSIGGKIKN